jgi:hypothetical protein
VAVPWVKDVKKLFFRIFKRLIELRGLLGCTLLTRWLGSTRTTETVRAYGALQNLRPFSIGATLDTFNSCFRLFKERFYEGQISILNQTEDTSRASFPFFYYEHDGARSLVVNVDHVRRKLPSLLCDGDTSEPENSNMFMRNRYRLRQFQKRNPQRFNCLVNQLCAILDEIDKEMAKTIGIKI